jgi:hypothetical protein
MSRRVFWLSGRCPARGWSTAFAFGVPAKRLADVERGDRSNDRFKGRVGMALRADVRQMSRSEGQGRNRAVELLFQSQMILRQQSQGYRDFECDVTSAHDPEMASALLWSCELSFCVALGVRRTRNG